MAQLQIHDEVILEGPAESAEEAMALVVGTMGGPVKVDAEHPLRVELAVDAKIGKSWYEAK
eukprot:COSAG05_NODE_2722_length_2727_cov_1.532725_3_plen_61_part_00